MTLAPLPLLQFCATILAGMKRLNIKYLAVSLILLLSLLIGSSCSFSWSFSSGGSSPPPATGTSAPTNPDWSPPPVESNASELPDFVTVVAKVKPSVVAINTEIATYDIFNRPVSQKAAGSGWIIDEDGYIVTNNHVVEEAESITVILDDGRTFPAGIVGSDVLTDLAVLKIDAEDLVKASRGNTDELDIGEWVLAIGNSMGLGVTPSEGIVRCLGASITVSPGQTLSELIGTSAAINPGNSGGPLVNMQGQVVGITSIKIAMVGVEGMGWAISINSATPIITELIKLGRIIRPYIGISYRDVTPYLTWQYNLAVTEGVLIVEVVSGYPADEAGLEPYDVIVGFNDEEINSTEDLRQAINACQVGQRVKISYWRGNSKKSTYATLVESPAPS